jgi:hypothetical protein
VDFLRSTIGKRVWHDPAATNGYNLWSETNMDSLPQMLFDWRFLLVTGIIVIYGVSRLFKSERSSEDITSLVERFHNELVAAETAIAHDATVGAAFESNLLEDPVADPLEHAEMPKAAA